MLLLDNCAWARLPSLSLPDSRRTEIAEMIEGGVEDPALVAQSELARRGHHRSASPSDLLIAACAHVHGSGVPHYDRDYDVLLELTGLDFESQWLAPAGRL